MKKLLVLGSMMLSGWLAEAQIVEETDTTQSTIAKMYQDIELFKRLKITGYIQAQFQMADSSGEKTYEGGDFAAGVDKRFMVRRGRVKFVYDAPGNKRGISTSQYQMQIDVTEKGLRITDAFVKITDPWIGWVSLTGGMMNRPFGYEVPYSSNLRESPERGRMSQILFPNERDLGGMLTIQGPKTSTWHWIKLDAGFYNGTGSPSAGASTADADKFKDFIGHIGATHSNRNENIKYSGGLSYYNGGYRIDSVNVYRFDKDSTGAPAFLVDRPAQDNGAVNIASRSHTRREYYGADAQFSIDWMAGLTTLRGEYIQGYQPGESSGTTSPAGLVTKDIYNREFNGAYFYFIHNILQTPLQLVVKYDWYDPNTKVSGDDIGKAIKTVGKKTNATDIKYTTLGFGLSYRWDSYAKITAYYDLVKNETSQNLSGYQKDIPDNVITLRLQIRF